MFAQSPAPPVKAPVSFIQILMFVGAAFLIVDLADLFIDFRSSVQPAGMPGTANPNDSPYSVTDKHLLDAVRKNAGTPDPVMIRDLRRYTHIIQSANGQRIPSVRTLCGVADLAPATGQARDRSFVATTVMSEVMLSLSSGHVWITWDKPGTETESCRDTVTPAG